MTTGIYHIPKSKREKKRKINEKVCTLERVDIGKGGSYCRPCFRLRKGNPNLSETFQQGRFHCQTSRLGCNGCGEHVCE